MYRCEPTDIDIELEGQDNLIHCWRITQIFLYKVFHVLK